jgi:3-hydroxyisobutyrate dehydrogenase-like beta-hydroxyacid dehydrogenase
VAARALSIVLCLPDHAVVHAVLAEIEEALQPGHALIDTTTGDSGTAERLAAELLPRGIHYVEATISGSSDHVRHGTALLMLGGDAAVIEQCRDVLGGIAPQRLHAGPVGAASKLKLATNLVLGLNRAAFIEGLAFAQAIGLDPVLTLQALREGVAYSRIMDTKGPKLLARDFTPQAKLSQHAKDVRLMLEAAQTAGLKLPLSEVHAALLQQAIESGFGELDNCALRLLYDQ